MFLIILSFCSCVSKADRIHDKIAKLPENDNISQEEIDSLLKEYNELSVEEKSRIKNDFILKRYENVDIEKVKAVEKDISNIKSTDPFSDCISIIEEYNKLSKNEQAIVKNYDLLKEKLDLTDLEKVAVSAAKNIKKSLKSSGSLDIQSVDVMDDLKGDSSYYLVRIEYSATNSFGAHIDDTSFQTINDKFENPWWALSLLNGDYKSGLMQAPAIPFFKADQAVELDAEKIMYCIDKEIE